MLNPNDFGLKESPFQHLPGTEVTHWAGLHKTRATLEDVIVSVRPDDVGASECVILYGDWGAGKSHALRFFTGEIHRRDDACALYIGEVMTGGKPDFSGLYTQVLDQLGGAAQSRVVASVKSAVRQCAEEMEEASGIKVSDDMVVENKVASGDQEQVKKLLGSSSFLALPKKDDMDAAKKMASVFRVMTTSIGKNPPPYQAVYLFLDEMETVNLSKPPDMLAFYGALRALVNGITEHFALVLSYTAQLIELEATLPEFTMARATRPHIECSPLSTEGAKAFIREYLANLRPNGFSHENGYHPFSEGAIDAILERETNLNPRQILKHLRRVWERAARREGLQPKREITPEMAEKILEQIGI